MHAILQVNFAGNGGWSPMGMILVGILTYFSLFSSTSICDFKASALNWIRAFHRALSMTKWSPVRYCKNIFFKKKASVQSFYPKQRSSRVAKPTNEVRSFSFFKIIYSSTLAFVTFLLPHSFPMHPSFLYPLKTSKNLTVFWCFQGFEKGCIGNKWVNRNAFEK